MNAPCSFVAADLLPKICARALTLHEHAQSLKQEDLASLASGGGPPFSGWLYAAAAGDRFAFRRRLDWNGWNQQAAEPHPDWASLLSHSFKQALFVACEIKSSGKATEEDCFQERETIPFPEIFLPFLRVARKQLAMIAGQSLDSFSNSARIDLELRLLSNLSACGATTVYESFDRWRSAAAPGSEVYQTFVTSFLEKGYAGFFLDNAALARRLATTTALWVAAIAELAARLATDRPLLERQLADGKSLGTVVQVDPGLSESHGGGRRVMSLTFSCGLRVVYKPRPVAIEAAFQDLLRWLATRGLSCAPAPLRIISRPGYGWGQWLEPAAARNRPQVERYFERAGALLCLVELLGGDDLHAENVVATEDGPVLIDVETLFQPRIDEEPSGAPPRLRSQLATSLQLDAAGVLYDLGGFQGHEQRLAEARRLSWHAPNTDAMAPEECPAWDGPGPNVLFWRGRPCLPATYRDALARGFGAAYQCLLRHREELLADDGPLSTLRSGSTRVLLRGSQQYAEVLLRLRQPRFQSTGVAGDLLIEARNRPFSCDRRRPSGWDAVAEERAALLAGDIPRFEVPVDGTAIQLPGGRTVRGCFAVSGFQAARMRLERMSEDSLSGWLLEIRRLGSRGKRNPPRESAEPPAESWNPLAQAVAVGRRLMSGSDTEKTSGERGLYGGLLGLAVFIAALARQTGDPDLRARAVALAQAELSRPLPRRRGAGVDVGGFAGVGGELYAASLIASWLEDSSVIAAASQRLRRIESHILDRAEPDLAAGLAGCTLGALALSDTTGDSAARSLAVAAGERMTARIEEIAMAHPGVAHGFAGIVLTLLRLADSTGDGSWIEPARRAWEREWHVRAAGPGFLPSLTRHGQGWCRGSAGIGLVALRLFQAEPGLDRPVELSTAVATVNEEGLADLDTPCCGAPGQLDLLLEARPVLNQSSLDDRCERLRALWWRRLAAQGPQLDGDRQGRNHRRSGLFRGWAGVGYQLLRTSRPEHWPSILMFEPPVRSGRFQEVLC